MSILYGGDDHIARKQDEAEDFAELVELMNPQPRPQPVESPIFDTLLGQHPEMDDPTEG